MRTTRGRQGLGGLSMLLIAVMSGAIFFAAGLSHASIIVSDDFSGTDGDAINGRTPDGTNLPTGTWYSVGEDNLLGIGYRGFPGNNPFGREPTISGNTALLTINSSAFTSLQSSGGYTKPTQFTISGDIKVGTITGDNLGVGLAFTDDKTNFSVSQAISLGANGDLNFNQTLIASYNPSNFGGSLFDPNSFYHLSYTVDTSTGGVSNIALSNGLGSQSYTLSTTVFTSAKTAYAGIISNSSTGSYPLGNLTTGNVDNFLISVPEPASLSLLAGGALLLVRRRR